MRFRFFLLIQMYIHLSLVQLTRSRRLFVLSPVHLAYDHDKFMEYTFVNEFLAFADIWQRNVCSVCNTLAFAVAVARDFSLSLSGRFKKCCYSLYTWMVQHSTDIVGHRTVSEREKWSARVFRSLFCVWVFFLYIYILYLNKNLWQIYIISFYRIFFGLYLYNVGISFCESQPAHICYLAKHVRVYLCVREWIAFNVYG